MSYDNVILKQNHRTVEDAGPYIAVIKQLAKPEFDKS